MGAAFGTSKAGIGIAGLGTFKPELVMKVRVPLCALAPLLTATQSLIPVVMSGIIAVYGLVVSVLDRQEIVLLLCLMCGPIPRSQRNTAVGCVF